MACTEVFHLQEPHATQLDDADLFSGVGRCFSFWQEVMGCYVVNTSSEDDSGKKKCTLALEDYYECLHHKKEVCLIGSL